MREVAVAGSSQKSIETFADRRVRGFVVAG